MATRKPRPEANEPEPPEANEPAVEPESNTEPPEANEPELPAGIRCRGCQVFRDGEPVGNPHPNRRAAARAAHELANPGDLERKAAKRAAVAAAKKEG